uniref:Uncharacterized protein n=1 Tax=Anguilla anguilla TaxID=7936 RepID=A0A0E9X8Z9_ANGAN
MKLTFVLGVSNYSIIRECSLMNTKICNGVIYYSPKVSVILSENAVKAGLTCLLYRSETDLLRHSQMHSINCINGIGVPGYLPAVLVWQMVITVHLSPHSIPARQVVWTAIVGKVPYHWLNQHSNFNFHILKK